jgi:hypothetical protein
MPRTEASIPFGTELLPKAPPDLPTVDLARYGYVEEEYAISGIANTYSEDGTQIVKANLPYKTRLLIRRPKDPAKWSGDVQLGPFRDVTELSENWNFAWPYFVRHGDIWIGFTMAGANVAGMLKKFDPVRYARIDIPDDAIRMDLLAQVAWMAKSADGLLAQLGYPIQKAKVFSSGWSLVGNLQVHFINGGHHDRARTPDGGPVIDGYIPGIGMAALLRHPKDAPVIRVQSETEFHGLFDRYGSGDEVAIRQPDSDKPDDRFRFYELAGTAHADFADNFLKNIPVFQLTHDLKEMPCNSPRDTRSGKRAFARAAYANLSKWVRSGAAPPPASDRWIALNADGSIKRDEHGNTVGGVQPYWIAVPTSVFVVRRLDAATDPCSVFGTERPFPAPEFGRLYGDGQAYLNKVKAHLSELVRDRYMLEEDVPAEIERARQDVPGAQ